MRHWSLWLFLSALTLRLAGLGRDLLWYDETFTAMIGRVSFSQMLVAIRGDVHPPVFYLMTWLTSHALGQSEILLRLPSALFGAGAVYQLYKLVDGLAGNKPARWAAGIMAILPAQIYYSQEARMYALLTLLALLGANAVLRRNWLRVALCCALLPLTQNLGIFYSALIGGWALWQGKAAFLRRTWPALGYVAWAPTALYQASHLAGGFWLPKPNPGAMFYPLFSMTLGAKIPDWLLIHAMSVPIILTGVSLYQLATKETFRKASPMVLLALWPSSAMFTVSQLWHPILLDRACLPSGAALAGLWGWGFQTMSPFARKMTAIVCLPVLLATMGFYYFDQTGRAPADRAALAIIDNNWQPGDAVYHISLSSMISFSYYLDGKPEFMLPEAGNLGQSLSDETRAAVGLKQLEFLPQAVRAMGYKRIFLLFYDTAMTSDTELQSANLFVETYHEVNRWQIKAEPLETFTIYLLEL